MRECWNFCFSALVPPPYTERNSPCSNPPYKKKQCKNSWIGLSSTAVFIKSFQYIFSLVVDVVKLVWMFCSSATMNNAEKVVRFNVYFNLNCKYFQPSCYQAALQNANSNVQHSFLCFQFSSTRYLSKENLHFIVVSEAFFLGISLPFRLAEISVHYRPIQKRALHTHVTIELPIQLKWIFYTNKLFKLVLWSRCVKFSTADHIPCSHILNSLEQCWM